jgi:hypothetical protein
MGRSDTCYRNLQSFYASAPTRLTTYKCFHKAEYFPAPRRRKADGPTEKRITTGFPGGPVRDARSAEWERMTAVSLVVTGRGVIR